jgi:hypothetical protein
MYLIVSYDYRISNQVKIHCLTNDLIKANIFYKKVIDDNKDYNKDDNHAKMIELIQITEEFFNLDGFALYRDELSENIKILKTNITEWE